MLNMLFWMLNMVLMAAFVAVVGQGIVGLKRGALIDERNRISLSRLQLCLWTVLVLSSLVTAAILNVYRGDTQPVAIALPQELWWLMGISTTSLVGSSLIKGTKKDGGSDEAERRKTLAELSAREGVDAGTDGKLVVKASPDDANWYDLFMGEEAGNGSHLDTGKVQRRTPAAPGATAGEGAPLTDGRRPRVKPSGRSPGIRLRAPTRSGRNW